MNDLDRERPQLNALTGARFVAALYVLIFHAAIALHIVAVDMQGGEGEFKDWCAQGVRLFDESWYARGLVRSGFVAVSFFFTLSGFILTYSSLDRQNQLRVARRPFWAARFARVYPVYFVGLVVSLPMFLGWLVTQDPPLPAAKAWAIGGATLSLVQAWWPLASNVWNAPGWSLSVEAFFYFTFPWTAIAISQLSRRNLWLLMLGCWCVSLAIPIVYMALQPDGLARVDWTTDATWLKVVKFNPLIRLPEFLFGIALGRLFGDQLASGSWSLKALGAPLSALASILIVAALAVSDVVPELILHNGLLLPLFGLLIYSLAAGRGPVAWLLSSRWAVLLGNASYAMYILHYSIIFVVIIGVWLGLGGFDELNRRNAEQQAKSAAPRSVDSPESVPTAPTLSESPPPPYGRDSVPSPLGYFLLCVCLTIGASLIVHKLIEVPSRRVLRRWLSGRSAPSPPSVVADLP